MLKSLPPDVYGGLIISVLLAGGLLYWQLTQAKYLPQNPFELRKIIRHQAWLIFTICMVFIGITGTYHSRFYKLKFAAATPSVCPVVATPECPNAATLQPAFPTPEVKPANKKITAADLFGPSSKNATTAGQGALDELKLNYEDAFVMYFYMQKCGKADIKDFHLINSSLVYALAALNASSTVQQDILNASRGSYYEMYSKSSCDEKTLQPLIQKYQSYLQQLLANIRPL